MTVRSLANRRKAAAGIQILAVDPTTVSPASRSPPRKLSIGTRDRAQRNHKMRAFFERDANRRMVGNDTGRVVPRRPTRRYASMIYIARVGEKSDHSPPSRVETEARLSADRRRARRAQHRETSYRGKPPRRRHAPRRQSLPREVRRNARRTSAMPCPAPTSATTRPRRRDLGPARGNAQPHQGNKSRCIRARRGSPKSAASSAPCFRASSDPCAESVASRW